MVKIAGCGRLDCTRLDEIAGCGWLVLRAVEDGPPTLRQWPIQHVPTSADGLCALVMGGLCLAGAVGFLTGLARRRRGRAPTG